MLEIYNNMLIYKLHKYVTEPLYEYPKVNILNENMLLQHNLFECEKRILEILSYSEGKNVHIHMENFPWGDMEELMGDRLEMAIILSKKISEDSTKNGIYHIKSLFERYNQEKRAYFLR